MRRVTWLSELCCKYSAYHLRTVFTACHMERRPIMLESIDKNSGRNRTCALRLYCGEISCRHRVDGNIQRLHHKACHMHTECYPLLTSNAQYVFRVIWPLRQCDYLISTMLAASTGRRSPPGADLRYPTACKAVRTERTVVLPPIPEAARQQTQAVAAG